MHDKQIYIVLTHTGSLLSRAIQRCTGEPYTHVSIAFDAALREMYSFGRKKPDNPLFAGFVREDVYTGTYVIFKDTTYALYSLCINEEQYNRLRSVILEFSALREKSSYNFMGLLGLMFDFPINRKYSYFCSQFVAYAFKISGIEIFNKCPGLVSPGDFRRCKHLNFIGSGILSEYKVKQGAYGDGEVV